MADQEGTPLVPQEMLDAQPSEAELTLPTNADILETQDDAPDKDNQTGEGNGEVTPEADDGGVDNTLAAQAQTQEVTYEEVADPGEFAPGDYSFDVTVFDAEGQNGKAHKITSLEQWDELLETDPNLGNSAAVARAFRAQSKMERGQEDDKKQWDKARVEYDEAVKQQGQRDNQTTQWQNELDYLVAKNELPPMPKEFHVSTANWSDPKVAAQPAVKAQLELLDYLRTENAARAKAKLAPMTSLLDAWNGFAREQAKKDTATSRTQAGVDRKVAASKVAASAPKPTTTAPRGVSVGRVGLLD